MVDVCCLRDVIWRRLCSGMDLGELGCDGLEMDAELVVCCCGDGGAV